MLEITKERNELVICEFNGAIAQINKYMSEEECYNLLNETLKYKIQLTEEVMSISKQKLKENKKK